MPANTKAKITTIGRDPFGRFDYIRKLLPAAERTQSCAWCGKKNAKFVYGTHSDDMSAKPQFESRAYCTQACHNAHGVR